MGPTWRMKVSMANVALVLFLSAAGLIPCADARFFLPFRTKAPKKVVILTSQCTSAKYWYMDGTSSNPLPSAPFAWGSSAATSRFQPGPCLQVSNFHMVQTYLKTLVLLDRTDADATYFAFPDGTRAYGEEITLTSLTGNPSSPAQRDAAQRPLNVRTNTFCSSGQLDANGNLINIGGSWSYFTGKADPTGFFSIRQFVPCSTGNCDFTVLANLTTKRWYPSAQILADGRILIAGGSNDSTYMSYPSVNVPSIEYWPKTVYNKVYPVAFLVKTTPYNLYPFVHLLPSGKVFIFAEQRYTLFNTTTNTEIPGTYPTLTAFDATGSPIYRSYPLAGASAMLPLTSANGYKPEIIICGGGPARAAPQDRAKANTSVPADDKCWRISPEALNPTWTMDAMCLDYPTCKVPARRNTNDAVLLPDNTLLIINGGQQGYQSIPVGTTAPALTPLIYFPGNRTWNTKPLATSKIPRGYHSLALLLHDGSVFVGGSNPNMPRSASGTFITEFRTEFFYPPYFYGAGQPLLTQAPPSIKAGQVFSVSFTATQADPSPFTRRFSAVLVYSGFATHGHRHGMRNVVLDFLSFTSSGNVVTAQLKGPPSLNHAPPSYYWLFVLDNGIPCKQALAVQVKP